MTGIVHEEEETEFGSLGGGGVVELRVHVGRIQNKLPISALPL